MRQGLHTPIQENYCFLGGPIESARRSVGLHEPHWKTYSHNVKLS